MFYIGIKDVAANAIIEIMKKDPKRTYVTFDELEHYGMAVAKILNEKNEGAILVMSRNETNALFREYSDYFAPYLDDESDCIGISLIEDITLQDLIMRFRGYLALDVLRAFKNEQAVRVFSL